MSSKLLSANSSTANSSSGSSRNVFLHDEELLNRVLKSGIALTLKRALTDPVTSWKTKSGQSTASDSEQFQVFSRSEAKFEVLAIGKMSCSPQELAPLLCSSDENNYNGGMKALYHNSFIYGSIVHVVEGKSTSKVPLGHQLAVKTACFSRSKLFSKNEQWCLLEYFQPTMQSSSGTPDTSKGFSVSLVSMSEQELNAGIVVGCRVNQITGVTVLVVVDTESNSDKVRVIFHAIYTDAGKAAHNMARDRLFSMAAVVSKLPAVVRRRRLGVQVFADSKVVASEVKNSRCISCTKSLRFSAVVRVAKRCQLCAYNVCTSCWSSENVETTNGRIEQMGVCRRCLEWVDRCDFTTVDFGHPGPVRIVEDPVQSRSKSRGGFLREELAKSTSKDAAVSVIKLLLGKIFATSFVSNDTEHEANDDVEENKYMAAVGEYFDWRSREAPAAADCVLANAERRTYPLQFADRSSSPALLVPENELQRLKCIERLGLMDLDEQIPELDVICSFLKKELGLLYTMVAILGKTQMLVLSSSRPELVRRLLPREHVFCQHLLFGDAPFIIRNPQADVRFYNMNPVARGVKFYCGIPITGPNGLIVGSLCGIQNTPMDITRLEFDMLKRFGEIASKVIRVKAEAKLQIQRGN